MECVVTRVGTTGTNLAATWYRQKSHHKGFKSRSDSDRNGNKLQEGNITRMKQNCKKFRNSYGGVEQWNQSCCKCKYD